MNPLDEEVIRKKATDTIRAHMNRTTSTMIIGPHLGIKKGTLLTAGEQIYKVVSVDAKQTTVTLKLVQPVSWKKIILFIVSMTLLGLFVGQLILWSIQ